MDTWPPAALNLGSSRQNCRVLHVTIPFPPFCITLTPRLAPRSLCRAATWVTGPLKGTSKVAIETRLHSLKGYQRRWL